MSTAQRWLRRTARRTLQRLDNAEVRAARRLLRRLRAEPPDVVFFGESTVEWTALYDTDRRDLGRMVSDAVRDSASVHVIAGAGYSAEEFLAYLRLLEAYEARPLVVHPLFIRGRFSPWIEHPVYGHKQAIAKINSLDPRGPLWRARAGFPRPTKQDFDRHRELRYDTLIGEGHVRDYVDPLRGRSDDYIEPLRDRSDLSAHERVRLMYAYHHGHRLTSGSAELEPITRLGARLDELGVQTVVYHTPVSVETGVEVLGPEFAELVCSNRAVLEGAYLAGRRGRPPVLQTGDIFDPDEFVAPKLADEHLNDRGRTRLAELICSAVRAALPTDVSGWRRGDALATSSAP